jgi:hypothetical protein
LQELLPPHSQLPPVQVFPLGWVPEQTSQTSPPVPQWSRLAPTQLTPSQQPVQSLAVSQTQAGVPSQRCPAAHAAAEPQVQSPPTQLSARSVLQAAHAAPFLPQCSFDTWPSARQEFPSQQPSHPVVVAQKQVPPVPQWRPVPQTAPPLPQEHSPATQRSAVSASQAMQAAPPLPHWSALRSTPDTQVSPSQQPSAQVSALQGTATSAWASVWTGAASCCCGKSVHVPVWSPLWQ